MENKDTDNLNPEISDIGKDSNIIIARFKKENQKIGFWGTSDAMENKLYTSEEVQKLLDEQKERYKDIILKEINAWSDGTKETYIKDGLRLAYFKIISTPYPESFKTDKENN